MSRVNKIYLSSSFQTQKIESIENINTSDNILYNSKYMVIISGNYDNYLYYKSCLEQKNSEYFQKFADSEKKLHDFLKENFISFLRTSKKCFFPNLKWDEENDLKFDGRNFYEYSGYKLGDNANAIENIEQIIKKSNYPSKIVIQIVIDSLNPKWKLSVSIEPHAETISRKGVMYAQRRVGFDIVLNSTFCSDNKYLIQIAIANEFGDVWFMVEADQIDLNAKKSTFDELKKHDYELSKTSLQVYEKLYATNFSFLIQRIYDDAYGK